MSVDQSENTPDRLSKIYTRTGDKGETSLGEGRRVPKDHARMEAIGTVDELNCWMGLLINEVRNGQALRHRLLEPLLQIQHRLFDAGGELAMPGWQIIQDEHVDHLEALVDQFNADLPPLKNFILPGGSAQSCHFHMVRTVSRRAERRIITARNEGEGKPGEEINSPLCRYFNRLSDLMFVLARYTARQTGGEVLWQQSARKKV